MHPSDRFVDLDAAQSPVFARDGRTLFHLAGSSSPQLAALDLAGGAVRRLTAHADAVALVRRAPTDERLIYAVDAGGDERHQLHLLDPASGATRALTAAPAVMHQFGAWSPDGARIAYAVNARDEAHLDVHVMDLASNAAQCLHRGEGMRSVAAWSPAGDRLAVIDERSFADMTLRLVDLRGGSGLAWPRDGLTRYQALKFLPGGGACVLLTNAGREFMGVARFNLAGGTTAWLHAPERDVDALALSPDGRRLALVENVDGASRLLLLDVAGGAPRPVAGVPHGYLADPAWSADGSRLAFMVSTPTAPPTLWCWTAADDDAVPLHPKPAADMFVASALVSFPTFDGRALPAFFMQPRDAPPPEGRPAVVWVHGGPESQTRANFRADMQMLVDAGFAVLMPNVRGSTGYGRSFGALDDVALRLDSVRDLAHAHAWLAAQAGIDRGRIGLMGQSYGGFMVLAGLAAQPELWAVGVDYYGVSDFHTVLRETGAWRRGHRAAEYGDPVRDAALLREVSPIDRAAAIRVPLLVLHGKRDPRVPLAESERMVAALRALGKPVDFQVFDEAGHGFTRAGHRRAVYRAVRDFFTRHLQPAMAGA